MGKTQSDIKDILARLKSAAESGYALAFNIRYTTPDFLFQTYSKTWIDYYSQNGLVMQDPTVLWGFENTGTIRWSALADRDQAGMLKRAAEFGLEYGFVVAIDGGDLRTIGSFAQTGKEFSDEEIAEILVDVEALTAILSNAKTLAPELHAELRKMSVIFTHP